jgi:DNA-binding transcriptional LysR family regulator
MELRQLKTFQAVARRQSFQRAAEALNYAPSTVSTQIRLLEKELGVPLFDRLGRRIRLSAAGQMLVKYAERLLTIEKETVANVAGWQEPKGSLAVRMPQSLGSLLLPGVIASFRNVYPKVGLDISTCAYDTLVHELKTGLVDLAFLLADSIPYRDLISQALGIEPLVLVSGREHPLAGKPQVTGADLIGQTILLPKHDCSYKFVFEQLLLEAAVGPDDVTIMALNSVETIKRCVIDGIGVAMFPLMAIAAEIDQGRISPLDWPDDLETAILMIWHRDKWLSPALTHFMDTVRTTMAANADRP